MSNTTNPTTTTAMSLGGLFTQEQLLDDVTAAAVESFFKDYGVNGRVSQWTAEFVYNHKDVATLDEMLLENPWFEEDLADAVLAAQEKAYC